ncbi:MAG: IPT/TIG domain-containing protein, partial [Candidatus Promineifilaceae bacterium]|nr:IPT/TIG domain-containing protein [Candidatus Promineifilaceae bacterium]
EQVAQIPAMRLRAALQNASRPRINRIQQGSDGLRITGSNLRRDRRPQVLINGGPASILSASAQEILIEPPPLLSGTLAVETEPGLAVEADLSQAQAGNYDLNGREKGRS